MPVSTQNMTAVVRFFSNKNETDCVSNAPIVQPSKFTLSENRDVRLTAFLELDGLMKVLKNTINFTIW
jgi:hypothetical protein